MNSFEEISEKVKSIVLSFESKEDIYIVCDIQARFSIYITSNERPSYWSDMNEKLNGLVERIVLIEKDGYIYNDLNNSRFLPPICLDRTIYYVDRHFGLQNWDVIDKYKSKVPVVCFYSFKGGVGRTTALVLSAINLAKQGKKVVLMDFDLEAPGLSSLFSIVFPEIDEFKGVVDYMIDLMALKYEDKEIFFDDYYFRIDKQDIVGDNGGELVIFPASKISESKTSYISKLSKVNSIFVNSSNFSIDFLFSRVECELSPDYILVDTRTGLNDLSGLFLTRYASEVFMFFYGNKQNMFGLEAILPKLKVHHTKFYLVNSFVPPSPLGDEERNYFIETSYSAFSDCFYDEEYSPYINDETAPHYPIEVPYSSLAVLLNSSEKLRGMSNESNNPYLRISELISPTNDILQTDDISSQNNGPGEGVDGLLVALKSIAPEGSAASEYEFGSIGDLQSNFYPRKDYRFIFDRSKYLILGEKGAGKTALYAVLSSREYAVHLAKFCDVNSFEMNRTNWIKGLDQSNIYPSESFFEYLGQKDESSIRKFWQKFVIYALDLPVLASVDWMQFLSDCESLTSLQIEKEVDSVVASLHVSDTYVTIIYDYLDVLIREENNARGKILSCLIEVWRAIQVRYLRLSAKIFMRSDIFAREINLTDKVKLNNHISTISWDYNQLLNLVWKRLANGNSTLPIWVDESIRQKSTMNDFLGVIPNLQEHDNRLLLEKLLGQYMGGNNKAFPYNWILYHVSDTKTNIQPRSLLNLFSEAARLQLEDSGSYENQNKDLILKPKNMEMAMEKVSQHRVQDIKEEYPLLRPIFENLHKYHEQFPIAESDLDRALAALFEEENISMPLRDAKERLESIGVLYEYKFTPKNKEKRFHIPDLYLIGMGLKRKGPGAHKALFGKK